MEHKKQWCGCLSGMNGTIGCLSGDGDMYKRGQRNIKFISTLDLIENSQAERDGMAYQATPVLHAGGLIDMKARWFIIRGTLLVDIILLLLCPPSLCSVSSAVIRSKMDRKNVGSNAGLCLSSLQCKNCLANLQVSAGGTGTQQFPLTIDSVQSNGEKDLQGALGIPAKRVRRPNNEIGGGNQQMEMAQRQRLRLNAGYIGYEQESEKNWKNMEEGLGHQNNLALHLVNENPGETKLWKVNGSAGGFGNFDSPRGPESPPPGVLSHLHDIDAQIGWLRGESKDIKKAISQLATFVQISNSDIRGNTVKMQEFFDGLVSKMDTLHSGLRIMEAKVDCFRTSRSNNPTILPGIEDNEDAAVGKKKKKNLSPRI